MYNIKTVIKIVSVLSIISIISYLFIVNKQLKEELSFTTVNMKAYDLENSHLKDKVLLYQFNIDQLNFLNDSLLVQMNKVRKDLKIKDKEIKRLEYISSKISKTDTLYINKVDTIFKESNFYLDTVKKDNWYNLHLTLSYPNKIVVTPSFKSEKHIFTYIRRETIKPPKKCFIGRWFQRKHNVLEVKVVENNPYIETKEQKFIEIIK